MADNSLPLALRKDLKDKENYLLAELEKIKQATGIEFSVQLIPGWQALNDHPKLESVYKNNVARLIYENVLPNVTILLVNNAKDPMVKEAIVEKLGSAKSIIFKMVEPGAFKSDRNTSSDFHRMTVVEGCLVIEFYPEMAGVGTHVIRDFKLVNLL